MQNVTKKLGFLLVFVYAIIGLGGPILFLGIFLLCFVVGIRVEGAKKFLSFFTIAKKLIIFLYVNVDL
jgi:hypothetical protein